MKSTFSALLIAVMAFIASSCAGAAGEVRPNAIGAGEAIGETFKCTAETLKSDMNPFTADWSDSQRAALESAMKRGVAVVKMTCEGPKILKACQVIGNYAYSGVSLKTKVVQMQDLGSAALNLGGALFSPSLKTELSQGRWLNLAYMIAGAETTTVASVSPNQLKGRCQGATHFVYEAQLGAFTMETAEQGESKTAVDLLIGDASAETSASKSTRTTDGDPDSCNNAGEQDASKTEGCSALMRVDLMTISAEAPTAPPLKAPRVVACPGGFTWDGDSCQPASIVAYALCDEGDTPDCLKQCERGSFESCDRFASSFLFEFNTAMEMYGAGRYYDQLMEERGRIARTIPEHLPLLEKACAEEMPEACGVIGYHKAINETNDAAAADYFGRGCVYGDGDACNNIVMELSDAPRAKVLRYLDTACSRGVAMGCAAWASSVAGEMMSMPPRIDPGVADKASRACYGGFGDFCPIAAGVYLADADACAQSVIFGMFPGGVEMIGEWAQEFCETYTPLIDDDVHEAELLLRAGCDHGSTDSCGRLKDLVGDAEFQVPEIEGGE